MALPKKAPPAKPAKTEKEKPSKMLVKQEEKPTALAHVSTDILEADAQAAKGTFTKDDLMTPFLRVLQALSPQVKKQDEKHVDGAEEGMFIDTSDNELWDGEEGIIVIPVHYTPSYIEWKVREKGGGFIKDHGAVPPNLPTERDDKNREWIKGTDNQLVKSGLYYVYVVNEETGEYKQLAFPLQGTQLKKSRQWNTRMQSIKVQGKNGLFTPAPFYMAYKITTQFEKNDQGSWYGVNIEPYKPVIELKNGANIYFAAKDFKEMIASGRVRTAAIEVEAEVVSETTVGAEDDEY